MKKDTPFCIFSGSSHKEFSSSIAKKLNIKLSDIKLEKFPDNETSVQILDEAFGKNVFVVQTIAKNPNEYLVELLIMIDAIKRASPRKIFAVIPYFGYCRQDRKDKKGMPITAKLIADLLEKAGVDHVITMDLHKGQIEGFFNIPVDNIHSKDVFIPEIKKMNLKNLTVVSPDIGSNKLARKIASELNAGIAIVDKRRKSKNEVEDLAVIGKITENVVIVDDIVSTANTIINASFLCKKLGAKKIFSFVTHNLMQKNYLKNSAIDELYVTNSIPTVKKDFNIKVISVVDIFVNIIKKLSKF